MTESMRTRWYAVQVETGREDASCTMIEQAAEAADLTSSFEELFVPKRRTLTKIQGELTEGEEPLFPGYVIVVTNPSNLEAVVATLKRLPRFARLVGHDGEFVPLSDDEVARICAFTQKDHRFVEMSEGFVEGGRVTVVSGPLVGWEALIKKVDRRRRTAYLEFPLCGRTVETRVGLNLVRRTR